LPFGKSLFRTAGKAANAARLIAAKSIGPFIAKALPRLASAARTRASIVGMGNRRANQMVAGSASQSTADG
jgi:hypothetical protein